MSAQKLCEIDEWLYRVAVEVKFSIPGGVYLLIHLHFLDVSTACYTPLSSFVQFVGIANVQGTSFFLLLLKPFCSPRVTHSRDELELADVIHLYDSLPVHIYIPVLLGTLLYLLVVLR